MRVIVAAGGSPVTLHVSIGTLVTGAAGAAPYGVLALGDKSSTVDDCCNGSLGKGLREKNF